MASWRRSVSMEPAGLLSCGLVLVLAALGILPGWLGLVPRRSLDPVGPVSPAREAFLGTFWLV